MKQFMATHFPAVDTIARQAMHSKEEPAFCPTVLIFDSGVGGLSVYREIERELSGLHYIYVFDNEAFPYGEKAEKFIIERVLKIINAVQQQHILAVVVIACNTASTVSLPTLRARFSFPIVGVVPAIKPAAQVTRNGIIGLLATHATVNHAYTLNLIKRFASHCKIERLGSIKLVELAEAKLRGESVSRSVLATIFRPWLKMPDPPDTVVLGCTHFPLLAQEITQILPEGIQLIDSGPAIARRTAWLIKPQGNTLFIQRENIAYCMKLNASVTALVPVLQLYGFSLLHELVI